MVCYIHLLKNFPQFFVIHTIKGFSIVNEAEVDVFLEFSCFFQMMLTIYFSMFKNVSTAKSLYGCH